MIVERITNSKPDLSSCKITVRSYSKNECFLWGLYIASQPSPFKKHQYHFELDKESHNVIGMIDYYFPVQWRKK